MLNLTNFRKVENSNTRVNYDLKFSQKTGRFNLSQSAFSLFDMDNNGFDILTDGTQVALHVVPNDVANIHSGREGKNKGTQFTANVLAELLKLDADAEFKLERVTQDGQTFAVITNMNDTDQDTSNENVLVDIETTNEPQLID